MSFLLDVVPSVSLSLFSIFYPPVGAVLGAIDLIKFFFFSASVTNLLASGTSSIMEEYTTEVYTMAYGEDIGTKAGKAMGWINFILGSLTTILDASEVFVPPTHDIVTYHRADSSNYCIFYNVNGSELSMKEIISLISTK